MTIKHTRGQFISDAMIEHLYARLTEGACEHCGQTNITAGELGILRDVLKINGVEGIAPPEAATSIKSTKKYDYSQDAEKKQA